MSRYIYHRALFYGYFSNYDDFKYIHLKDEVEDYVYNKYNDNKTKIPQKLKKFVYSGGSNNIRETKVHKANGDFRRLTRINIENYIEFIRKTLEVEETLFLKLYDKLENENICTVLSKIYQGELFFDNNSFYDKEDEELDGDFFETKKSNVKFNDANFNFRFDFLYNFKIDLQNFYSTIYTHWLERISSKKEYCDYYSEFEQEAKDYIKWLDEYNMGINDHQTNGIVTGCYSSQITQEIFSVHIDYEITKQIKEYFPDESIKYTRYVDDYIFYFNNKSIEEKLKNMLMDMFFSYNLSLNKSKEEEQKLSVVFNDNDYVNSVDKIKTLQSEIITFYENNIEQIAYKDNIRTIFYSGKYKNTILINVIKNIYRDIENFLIHKEFSKAKRLLSLVIMVLCFDVDDSRFYNKIDKNEIRTLLNNLGLYENHFLYLCRTMLMYPFMSTKCTDHLVALRTMSNININNIKSENINYKNLIDEKYTDTLVMEIINYKKVFR